EQLQPFAIAIAVILVALATIYFGYVVVVKALRRYRIDVAAQRAGPKAMIAAAYADWRDKCTDFGYRHPTDTPLMFIERFVPDPEHGQLAWLVTRCLWGDLQNDCTPAIAADARELSRSLKRRLAQAQPFSVRLVAIFS